MILRKLKTLVVFFVMAFPLIYSNTSSATHISGGDLTYKSLGNNSYEVTLVLYRDCAGIPVQNPELISCVSASGATTSFNVYLIPGTGNEITFPCFATPTTCGGGSNPGYQRYEYKGNIILPPSINWNLSWQDCCRNCAITTTQGGCSNSFLIEANLNNLTAPNDNSPVFTNYPVSFVCIGQNFTYNHGVTDVEGDSLAYSFIDPRLGSGVPVSFQPGFSATNFIKSSTPILLDPISGNINFTPSMFQIGITAIEIKSYRNGVLIGSVMRDIQFVVQDCTPNILPTATGINGTSDFDTLVCAGTPLCFDIFTNDVNPGQVLTVTWNNGIPGGTFVTNGAALPTATFCWTPTQADARPQPYSFTILVKDDNCAYNAFQVYSYQIYVPFVPLDSLVVEPHCDSTELGAIYLTESAVGMPFQWQWSTGQTSSSLVDLAPGTYTVSVTNVIGCEATKTFTINPAPPSLNVSCLLTDSATNLSSTDGVLLALATGGTSPYTFSWSNGVTTDVNAGLAPGTYTVTVTDFWGCVDSSVCTVVTTCPTISCSGAGISCLNLCNGRAEVSVSGDPAGISFTWNTTPPSFGPSVSNLCPGVYTVYSNNDNNCVDSCMIVIPNTPCDGYVTYTQGGYGYKPSGNNPAMYVKNNFNTVFPNGLVIGCNNKITLTNFKAVHTFLPSSGTPALLPVGNWINPPSTYKNTLAGQLVAAKLNLGFDSASTSFAPASGSIGDLIMVLGPFNGWTVREIIEEADRAIGGCGSSFSLTQLNLALTRFNENYNAASGIPVNNCYFSCPLSGSITPRYVASNNPTQELNWDLIPNPATDFVNVLLKGEVDGQVTIQIFELNGKLVKKAFDAALTATSEKSISVDVSGIESGMYLLKLSSSDISSTKRLLIVKP
ncbi:MAG: T9SS type A sorting domain-containing protein [Bacteroidia bacterium]